MKITRVLLDLDGPLLDGKLRHYNCYKDILDYLGADPVSVEDYWNGKRQRKSREWLLSKSDALSDYDEFLRLWLELIETRKYLSLDVVQPGSIESLDYLVRRGVEIYLVTNRRSEANLGWQLQEKELIGCFAKVVQVDPLSGPLGKARRLSDLDETFGNSVWIGDTEADVLSAHEMGVPVGVVTSGLRDRDFLATLRPAHICVDLRGVVEKFFNS
jgi:phosphoglycolate phosphatase